MSEDFGVALDPYEQGNSQNIKLLKQVMLFFVTSFTT